MGKSKLDLNPRPPDLRKNTQKNKKPTAGFEPTTPGLKSQHASNELPRLPKTNAYHYDTDQYTYDTVLAIFSQLAPLCATLHLYPIKG